MNLLYWHLVNQTIIRLREIKTLVEYIEDILDKNDFYSEFEE